MTKLYTVNDVSELTRLSRATIYSYIAGRKIPFIKLGSRVLFHPDSILSWIEQRKVDVIR